MHNSSVKKIPFLKKIVIDIFLMMVDFNKNETFIKQTLLEVKMIKKVLKTVLLPVIALGFASVGAQEQTADREAYEQQLRDALQSLAAMEEQAKFSTSVNGNVRVELVLQSETKEDDSVTGGGGSIDLDRDDTYGDISFNYDNQAGTVGVLKLRFRPDSVHRYTLTGLNTTGAWTTKGFAEWDEKEGDGVADVSSQRDFFVHFWNDAYGFKLGRTTYLDTFRRGRGTVLYDGGVTLGTFDNRSEAFEFHIGLGIANVAVNYQTGNGYVDQSFFGSIGYDNTGDSDNTGFAVRANVDVAGASIGFLFGSGSSAGNEDRGGDADESTSVGTIGLGVSYDVAGIVTPYLNFHTYDKTVADANADETTIAFSGNNLGADLAFGAHSIGLEIGSSTATTTNPDDTESETTVASTELGYATSVGAASIKAGYLSKTSTTNEVDTVVSGIKVRFEYGF